MVTLLSSAFASTRCASPGSLSVVLSGSAGHPTLWGVVTPSGEQTSDEPSRSGSFRIGCRVREGAKGEKGAKGRK